MEYETLEYQLRLIILLAQGQFLSVTEMAERLSLHPRTVYRNLEYFPRIGLTLEKRSRRYRLSPEAPFLEKVSARFHFSMSEVVTLRQMLEAVQNRSSQVRHLREKLQRIHEGGVLVPNNVDETTAQNIRNIFEAIRQERVVLLKGYTSPNSCKKSDRWVEPFLFLPGNREVRCYEASSQMNKTFSLSRVEEVQLLDIRWDHADCHRPLHVDLFHFSGEERTHVRLRLGLLAKAVLLDEYPEAEEHLSPLDDGHWLFDAEFCSMKGIGRFVIGLLDDIEILDAPELTAYLKERVERHYQRFFGNP